MDVSTILIICADNDAGYRLTRLAKQADLEVMAVVRRRADPSALKSIGAQIIIADPTDRSAVAEIFADRDPQGLAVICLLGGTPQLNSQGNINVIDAAERAGIKRFVMVTSIGCGDSANAVDEFVRTFIGKALRAKDWAEKQLQATAMDWTIVRPGGMIRRRSTGGAPILVDSPNVAGYLDPSDLGDILFQVLQSPRTIRRALTAVNADNAVDVKGEPLVVADL